MPDDIDTSNNDNQEFTNIPSVSLEEEMQKSFSNVNSIMSRASKKGIFKKEYISRKLSSLSKQISKK